MYGVGVGVSRGNPRVNLGDLLFFKNQSSVAKSRLLMRETEREKKTKTKKTKQQKKKNKKTYRATSTASTSNHVASFPRFIFYSSLLKMKDVRRREEFFFEVKKRKSDEKEEM